MAMEFHEFRNGDNMVVMDGNRCVAKAYKTQSCGFILKVYDACWIDSRARTQGLFPGTFPHLLNIMKKREARSIMVALANTGRK